MWLKIPLRIAPCWSGTGGEWQGSCWSTELWSNVIWVKVKMGFLMALYLVWSKVLVSLWKFKASWIEMIVIFESPRNSWRIQWLEKYLEKLDQKLLWKWAAVLQLSGCFAGSTAEFGLSRVCCFWTWVSLRPDEERLREYMGHDRA